MVPGFRLIALGDDMVPGLCCSFLLAFFLGGDFESRTANHPFMAGYSRKGVVFSRFLTYLAASALIIAVYPMTRCLVATLRNGWGAPLPESFPLICKAFFLCLAAMIAGVSEFTTFAFLFRSTGTSMAAGIVLTLSRVMIQNMVCPHYPTFARIYEKTPMILATKIAQSNLTKISVNDCIQTIAISAAVITASFLVCLLLSRKSDFN